MQRSEPPCLLINGLCYSPTTSEHHAINSQATTRETRKSENLRAHGPEDTAAPVLRRSRLRASRKNSGFINESGPLFAGRLVSAAPVATGIYTAESKGANPELLPFRPSRHTVCRRRLSAHPNALPGALAGYFVDVAGQRRASSTSRARYTIVVGCVCPGEVGQRASKTLWQGIHARGLEMCMSLCRCRGGVRL